MFLCRQYYLLKKCCARLSYLYLIPLMALTCARAEEPENTPAPSRILMLNSYHQGFHWTDELVTAALKELRKIQPEPEIFVEYMDCKRFPAGAEDGRWNVFLERKYRHTHPDLVIVSDDVALTFMKKYRDQLFPGVPVIFCGINDVASALNTPENFTGIIETLDIPANLRLVQKLFPATDTIAVITDGTSTGIGTRQEIMETAKDFPGLKFIYLNGEDLTMQELINAMQKLPSHSVALAPAWYKDKSGQVYTNTESYPIISANCPVPVISTSASNMGLGLFGGKVNSGETQGGYAAQVARQILMDKINISRIPVETGSRNMYMFDARQLARFNVSESELPPESRILYRPFSFYRTYRLLVWAVIVVFIILVALVSVLAAEVIIRKRTAGELAESRNILSEVINTIPIRIFWKDLNCKYLGCNQLFARDAGRASPEDLIGYDDYNLVWKDQAEAFQATDREVIQNELPKLNYEEQQLFANGSEVWVCTSKVPMHDAKGKICGVLGILQDVSERKLNEQTLRQNEENLRVTLNSIGDAVIATDVNGNITRMNPVAEELSGWKQDEAAGKHLSQIFIAIHADTRDPIECPVDKVLTSGDAVAGFDKNTLLLSRSGKEHRIADSSSPIFNDAEKAIGVVLVFRDITQEYAIQEQLRQAQKMDGIGQLAGGVAHDFNNMLGGIMGATELLKRKLNNHPDADKYLDIILKATRHAADLTSKLLTFARKQPAASTPVNISRILRDALAILRRTIDRRIKVRSSFQSDSFMVIGDPSQLQSAFLNLLINASQAIDGNGLITATIRSVELDEYYCTSCSAKITPGRYVEIEIRDTGHGIPRENLTRIFEPFFTTKETGKGTGLGLAAVFGTVQQHSGAINVYSEPGTGTSFHIFLPLTEDPMTVVADTETPALISGQGKIMIVDDEEVMRITARAILEDLGYEIITAKNGLEAVELLKQDQAIDLVILDMIMPEMNGRDCFFALKKIYPSLRVILSSGFTRDEDLHSMREAGLNGFIRKPFRSSELSRAVSDVMKQ